MRNVSGQVRYAIPFFCDPDHDTVIECLPSCGSADNPAKYTPIRFGDYALWFASKSYQHMANEPALLDTVVAPGARATAPLVTSTLAGKNALAASTPQYRSLNRPP